MSSEPVIRVEGLWKRYGLPAGRQMLAKAARMMGRGGQGKLQEGPWALRDINMEILQGETVGLIGRNGAGKSTLLKVLAGVSPPTWGRVEVRQRLFPMIELNAGIHFDLTGRENVYLLGAIMGLDRAEMNGKFKEIEEFCELGDWMDRPVRKYSSGMTARLGFGVAMNVNAEILLIDEVLAVGDMIFQRKCYQRLDEMRRKGVTILFVSHNMRQVERLCDRAYDLEAGRTAFEGPADEAVRFYLEKVDKQRLEIARKAGFGSAAFLGTGELMVTGVRLLNSEGIETEVFISGEPITFEINFTTEGLIKAPIFAVGLLTNDLIQTVLETSDRVANRRDFNGEGMIRCTMADLPLAPGVYSVKVGVVGTDGRRLFKAEGLRHLQIADGGDPSLVNRGLVLVKAEWET